MLVLESGRVDSRGGKHVNMYLWEHIEQTHIEVQAYTEEGPLDQYASRSFIFPVKVRSKMQGLLLETSQGTGLKHPA